MNDIYSAITRERRYQDLKWGENPHTVGEFLLILEGELDEAKRVWRNSDAEALREILHVIALGVACLEQHGVVERQYPKSWFATALYTE